MNGNKGVKIFLQKITLLKVTSLILLVTISLTLTPIHEKVLAENTNPDEISSEQLREIIEGIIHWKKQSMGLKKDEFLFNNEFLQNAGATSVDWYPIGIGRIGYEEDYESYLAVIKDVVEKRYKERNQLSKAKATEWHRISLAILAAGGNPRKVGIDGDGQTIDLIADGTYNRGKTMSLGAQGLNGWIWGLIALDSMRYNVPNDAFDTRESIIEKILSAQREDGGFSLLLSEAYLNVDITAMTLQALAPYYNSEEVYTYKQIDTNKKVSKTVREVVDEALQVLSETQLPDGEFTSWGSPNAESTVQVIVALTSLGINPLEDERFIKNDDTLIDVLLRYRMDDGGFVHSFSYDPENPTSLPNESNSLATEQSLYAFVSLLRYIEGYRHLYDFREEWSPEQKQQIDSINESISLLPKIVTDQDKNKVEQIVEDYLQLPVSERVYIYNYVDLVQAMETLDISLTVESFTEQMGETNSSKGMITSIFDDNREEETEIVFTEEDISQVKKIPEQLTTEYEVEVIKWLERLQNASNKDEHKDIEQILRAKQASIESIKEEVEQLNMDIMQQLYPFDQIQIKDKENVIDIMKRYERLSAYDQSKIELYEDVERSYVQINSLIRAKYIAISILIIITIMSTVTIYRVRKRRKERQFERKRYE